MDNKIKIIVAIEVFILIIFGAVIIAFAINNANLTDKLTQYKHTISQKNKIIKEYKEKQKTFIKIIDDQYNTIKKIDNQSKVIMKQKEDMYTKLSALEKRKELYDKYSYVIMYAGNRTDVTYDQIEYGEKLMKQKGYDPNLLFGIVMTESRGTEKVQNSCSTARGYGQFLDFTAKYVYEKMLKRGVYNHDYAYNGYTNIAMMVELLDYGLSKTHDIYRALENYTGYNISGVYKYSHLINRFVSRSSTSVAAMNRRLYLKQTLHIKTNNY